MKITVVQREIIVKEKTIIDLIRKLKHAKVISQEDPTSNFGHMRIKLFKMSSNFGNIMLIETLKIKTSKHKINNCRSFE